MSTPVYQAIETEAATHEVNRFARECGEGLGDGVESELAGEARSVVIRLAYERASICRAHNRTRRFRSRQGGRAQEGNVQITPDQTRSDRSKQGKPLMFVPQVR